MSDYSTTTIQEYFEGLCEKHVDLRHNFEGRRAFAWFKTESHIREIANAGTENIVVVSALSVQRIGDFDEKRIRRGVSLIFAAKAINNDLDVTEAIKAANAKAEEILLDFVAKIDADFEEGCDELQSFEPEKISWEDIDAPWLDNYYGYELFMPFKSYLPPYDSDKWVEPEPEPE